MGYRNSLLIGLFLLILSAISAQPVNRYINDVVLPTPNAAALGQYIDVPVNHFTGTPNISIPLYAAQDGPLADPISMSYHAGGIRSTQQASWVGLGWTLNAGGMVTRTVQGLPDTGNKGYYFYDTSMDLYAGSEGSFITGCSGLPVDEQYISEIGDGTRDGEPDIYSFTVPGGYSGKFTIDKNGKPYLIPRQDIKVELRESAGRFTHIIITTPDGNKHYFGNTIGGSEDAYDFQITGSNTYVINWHLVRSTTYDGLYNIDYTYVSDSYSYRVPKSNTIEFVYNATNGMSTTVSNTNNSFNTISISGKKLASVTTISDTVTINSVTSRSDLSGSEVVNFIKINTGGLCKRYDLTYDYFSEGTSLLTPDKLKLRLNSIQERSCDNSITNIPPHTFQYYGNVQANNKIYLPGLLSKQIDHWGYYNGQSGNDFKSINIPQTSLLACNGSINTEGSANRDVNPALAVHGSLLSITYPTGGKTTFIYESHDAQFYSSAVNQMQKFNMQTCGTLGPNCCGNLDTMRVDSFTQMEVDNPVVFEIELARNQQPPLCPSNFVFTKVSAFLDGVLQGSLLFLRISSHSPM